MQFELLSYIDWPLGQWVIACINCWGLPEVALGRGEMSEVFCQKMQDEWVYLVHCRFWQKYEEETPANDHVRKALLCVVRRHLTPPPSSTNVERLFSYGGLVATDHRSSLSGEKLDQILFLRENALMANFDLGWN